MQRLVEPVLGSGEPGESRSRVRAMSRRDLAGRWCSWFEAMSSFSIYCVLASAAVFLLLSEAFLLLQFPRKFSWSPPTPPDDAPSGFTPTPLGWLLALGGRPEETSEVGLLVVGAALLLCCGWSLNRIEIGFTEYRMDQPYATDTSSLAFNSAVFCRIAVMLVLNVDMLALPVEANGLRTPQTRFYCTFGKKARLIIPTTDGHDYYLLAMPLLMLLLCVALYFNILAQLKSYYARVFHTPAVVTFRFGRTAVPWHEDKGLELLSQLQAAHAGWAHAVIRNAFLRRSERVRPAGPGQLLLNTARRLSTGLSFSARPEDGGHSSPRPRASMSGSPRSPSSQADDEEDERAAPGAGGSPLAVAHASSPPRTPTRAEPEGGVPRDHMRPELI